MKTLGLNKKLKLLSRACDWLCEYISNKIISIALYKIVDDELQRFDEERWYSNNHKGLTA